MAIHELAGQPATSIPVADIPGLLRAYHEVEPDPKNEKQQVSFGTSGHRGSSKSGSFNEAHILAITQAICDYRLTRGIGGPLFLGMDTHALSKPAFETALRVLASNGVDVCIDSRGGFTPTPAISLAILAHKARTGREADGIIITPSHNPPEDGGFKYNPPEGGPADTGITGAIQKAANAYLAAGLKGVRSVSVDEALDASTTRKYDYLDAYVGELGTVIDMDVIRSAKLKIGVHPLGGAGVAYWPVIAERYGIDLQVVDPTVDPTFRFMTLDWDGKIRMDCSSKYAMKSLIDLKTQYDIAFGNDTDYDRHGIVTKSVGLMNPNHYLAVAVDYLYRHRPEWPATAEVGKTIVTSSMIDFVAKRLERGLKEVPVGFKWFVDGLLDSSLGFGGEESAGASFLRRNGTVWVTEKDGIILGLLAVEMCAREGKDPGELYAGLTAAIGPVFYGRTDVRATDEDKKKIKGLTAEKLKRNIVAVAGAKVVDILDRAPGNGEPFGGIKVLTEEGWFAVRPSGTEDLYKIYAESFTGEDGLKAIHEDAEALMNRVLGKSAPRS